MELVEVASTVELKKVIRWQFLVSGEALPNYAMRTGRSGSSETAIGSSISHGRGVRTLTSSYHAFPRPISIADSWPLANPFPTLDVHPYNEYLNPPHRWVFPNELAISGGVGITRGILLISILTAESSFPIPLRGEFWRKALTKPCDLLATWSDGHIESLAASNPGEDSWLQSLN